MSAASPTHAHDALYAAHAPDLAWVPWTAEGIYFKLLNADPESGCFTVLLKVEPGTRASVQRHIDPAEAFVLEGSFHYADDPEVRYCAGSYVRENAGAVHEPVSPEGTILFAVFHGPIERFGRDGRMLGTFDWRWHVHAWNAAGGDYPV
jgi:quercetin dioxygenase-like cupin family protein